LQDEIVFYGHQNVQSLHQRTIEITKEEHLTLRGDCIIGVRADKACADLDEKIKNRLMSENSYAKIEIIVGDNIYTINGAGDKRLTLSNKQDIVIRKSNFVCPRTMSIRCNKASSDIPKEMVMALQNPQTKGIFRITAE
jgi:hypothetical protein